MKRKFKNILFTILLSAASLVVQAQQPPHPNGGNTPGAGNGPVGGGATVGSGLSILMAMGLAFGLRKYYQNKNSNSVVE